MFRLLGIFFLVWGLAILAIVNVGAQDDDRSLWSENTRITTVGGRTTIDAYIHAVNYKAPWKGVNEWTEISPTWQASSGPWNWESSGVEYDVQVQENFSSGQVIEWVLDGSYLRLQPMALQWNNALNQIDQIAMPSSTASFFRNGNTISFDSAYVPGTKVNWTLTNTSLRKELIVAASNTLPLPAQYILDGGNPFLEMNFIFSYSSDLTLRIDGLDWNGRDEIDTSSSVEFRKNGVDFFNFASPIVTDVNGAQELASLRFKKSGNSLYVSVRVDKGWLDTAIYPVRIDPTIDVQVGASGDDGYCESGGIGSCYSNNQITIVGLTAGKYWDSWHRWTGITIPLGDTIDVAYIEFYESPTWPSGGTPVTDFYFEDANNPAAPTTSADLDGRVNTTATIQESGNPVDDAWWSTASIVAIIQELVDANGYSSEAMIALGDNTGQASGIMLQASTWDLAGNVHGAKLHIEYSSASPTPTPTPTVTPTPLPVSPVSVEGGAGIASIVYGGLLLGFIIIAFTFNAGFFFIAAIFVLIPLAVNLDNMYFYVLTAGMAALLIYGTVHAFRED